MSKQPPPSTIDDIARDCIAVRMRMFNRLITNLYDEALRPLGVKVSQMNILVATAKLGVAQPAQVCAILQLDASTLSRNVERMRARGWLEVVPGDDARAQPFRLTPAGRKLLERTIPAWEKAQRKAVEFLGEDGVALLRKTMKNSKGETTKDPARPTAATQTNSTADDADTRG
ncbi:MAG: MarR family winged helix-turn-helix transcriptional regulator [Deltaproteobacteria bacterium]